MNFTCYKYTKSYNLLIKIATQKAFKKNSFYEKLYNMKNL